MSVRSLFVCKVSVCLPGVGSSSSSQWDFWGSTLVTSSYVRLTPDDRSKQGSIWNTVVREIWINRQRILFTNSAISLSPGQESISIQNIQ